MTKTDEATYVFSILKNVQEIVWLLQYRTPRSQRSDGTC